MRLEGCLHKGPVAYAHTTVQLEHREDGFAKSLDRALLKLCKDMGIPLPIWLQKNTKEFARFHQTYFFKEQFADKTNFDSFQITLLTDDEWL